MTQVVLNLTVLVVVHMNLSEINPYLRLCIQSVIPANRQINRRIILDYELICLESGQLELEYNGTVFRFGPGDILLLCPGIPHAFHVLDQPVSQPHIHFDLIYDSYSPSVFISFQDMEALSEADRQMLRENLFPQLAASPLLAIRNPESFRRTFFRIIRSENHQSLQCKAWMLQLIETILADLSLPEASPRTVWDRVAFPVRSYLDANFQQDCSLDSLAQQFCYSKFYLETCFRQAYGVSILQYRNRQRMVAAAELLKDHSVTETAQLTGFSSIYSFSRAFRNHFGVSPSQYKNSPSDR